MSKDRPPTTHVRATATAPDHVHVDADVSTDQRQVEVRVTVPAGHLPMPLRGALVEQVFALPEVAAADTLRASIPLGDYELLAAFCLRCQRVHTRGAGATCLIEADLRD